MINSEDNLANAQRDIKEIELAVEFLEKDNKSTLEQVNEYKAIVDKFTQGNEKIEKMLGVRKRFGDMSCLGCIGIYVIEKKHCAPYI